MGRKWVTSNTLVEAPPPISVYAEKCHVCHANGGMRKVAKRVGDGYGIGVWWCKERKSGDGYVKV